jgi:hypothetical protein
VVAKPIYRLGIKECWKRPAPPARSAEVAPNCFIVRDANGQALSYIYYESETGRRSAAKLLNKDEARRIAANVAKLPRAPKIESALRGKAEMSTTAAKQREWPEAYIGWTWEPGTPLALGAQRKAPNREQRSNDKADPRNSHGDGMGSNLHGPPFKNPPAVQDRY